MLNVNYRSIQSQWCSDSSCVTGIRYCHLDQSRSRWRSGQCQTQRRIFHVKKKRIIICCFVFLIHICRSSDYTYSAHKTAKPKETEKTFFSKKQGQKVGFLSFLKILKNIIELKNEQVVPMSAERKALQQELDNSLVAAIKKVIQTLFKYSIDSIFCFLFLFFV